MPQVPDIFQAIRATHFADLSVPDGRQEAVFREYLKLASFLQSAPGVKTVLELGSGYSTIILARLAQVKGFSLHCLDYGFNGLRPLIAGTPYDKLVRSRAQFHEGLSIDAKDLDAFYRRPDLGALGDASAERFRAQLSFFIRDNEARKWRMLEEAVGGRLSVRKAVDLFLPEGRLRIPRSVRARYEALTQELKFMRDLPSAKTGLLRKLIARIGSFDAVFFDCGEFSSMVEWTLLRERISIGGFAAFHDIYFPKSFKNFIPCAAVAASDRWRVVYVDESTPQGLLIAQRLR